MLVKAVTLFLVAMVALAIFGRLRVPGPRGRSTRRDDRPTARKCPRCGAYVIGDGPCPCERRS